MWYVVVVYRTCILYIVYMYYSIHMLYVYYVLHTTGTISLFPSTFFLLLLSPAGSLLCCQPTPVTVREHIL